MPADGLLPPVKGRDAANAPKPRLEDGLAGGAAELEAATLLELLAGAGELDDRAVSSTAGDSPPSVLGLIAPVVPLMPPDGRAILLLPNVEDVEGDADADEEPVPAEPASQLGPETPALALELANGEDDAENDENVGCFREGVAAARAGGAGAGSAAFLAASSVLLLPLEGCSVSEERRFSPRSALFVSRSS